MTNDSHVVRRPVPVPVLDRYASVLAVIPHYRCEAWLGQCLDSLLSQSRPLQRIVVVDDHSEEPPIDIVRRFPGVTLLAAEENVGPYRLMQAVIDQTQFDAYLFGHADDWSARERLEVLLAEADRTGAELIGSQELRILCESADAVPIRYPLDVNAALEAQPSSSPLLHPSSLVARVLLERLGGFATGLRTSADTEFLRRATLAARVVNVPEFLYFRRARPHERDEETRTHRAAGGEETLQPLWERARANAAIIASGGSPDLSPFALARPVSLIHHCGPPLNAVATRPSPKVAVRMATSFRRRPADTAGKAAGEADGPSPVFVIGAPRSSVNLLVWCLGQHPNLPASLDSGWIGHLALSLQTTIAPMLPNAEASAPGEPPAGGPCARPAAEIWRAFGETAHRLVAPSPARRWVDGSPDAAFHVYGLLRMFPRARFIHVVREAGPTVASLVDGATADGAFHTETSALEYWLRASRAGLDAERALGSATVLRVRHEEMVRAPEDVIRRCLDFLDEPYFEGCTWPLTTLGRSDHGAEANGSAPLNTASVYVVQALEDELLADAEPDFPGHERELSRLARDFVRRFRAVPEPLPASPAQRLRNAITAATPPGAVILVVGRADDAPFDLEDREARHFPPARADDDALLPPTNSAEAIEWLEVQRALGAEYLVFPSAAFWWLDHYPEFRQHVERNCRASIHQQDRCRIYALQPLGTFDADGDPHGSFANGVGPVAAAPVG